MTGEKLFKEYVEKDQMSLSGFFKTPRTWIIILGIAALIVFGIMFYNSLVQGMSAKEVKNSIEIIGFDTKWVDKEVTPEEVKIVPAISFKIKNIGERPLRYMDIVAVFQFVESGTAHSEGMARLYNKSPLLPGETSEDIFIKSAFGYSASSRASFIQNKKEWKKMEVKLFARATGSPLAPIGEVYPVKQIIEGYDDTTTAGEKMPEDYTDESTRELAHSIRIDEQDSLWLDRLVTDEKVIIVPSITVKISNIGKKPIQKLYLKGVFKYEDTGEVLSEGITPALKKPLAPGESSQRIEVKGEFGYTASSKEAFFKNTQQRWKHLKVHLYAKSTESRYALLGIFPIKAKIQGVKVVYH